MKKFLVITTLALFLALPILAATNDLTADGNITVQAVSGDITKDLLIMSGASVEGLNYNNGVFTVTNPGTFKVGSADPTVTSIKIKNSGGTVIACANNSSAGTSYVTLPTAAGTYTVLPSNVNCTTLCSTITGADTYYNNNGTYSIPSCGAATCAGSYTLSGSGTTAACDAPASGGGSIISGGSGGGGGGGGAPTTYQTTQTTGDGTTVNTKTTGDTLESTIKPSTDPKEGQVVTMDTSSTAEVKKVKVGLTSGMIKELSSGLTSGQNISVSIKSQEATAEQKTNEARAGMYMIGFDIFSIDIFAGDKRVTQLTNPVTLTFNITGIPQPENLKVYYYNETKKIWEQVGDGGGLVNGELVVSLDHLTKFALMRPIAKTTQAEILSNTAMQWQNILGDAGAIKGNLTSFLFLVGAVRNTAAEAGAASKYTAPLVSGLKNITEEIKSAITNFINYGTQTTKKLGAGERAGVLSSYKSAFGKVPATEAEWKDAIAIGNGRWPTAKSAAAETKAAEEFNKVYKRSPNMKQPNDNAAVTVIAYGLRPTARNQNSEKIAIKSFRAIYGHDPVNATAWDIVRSIAYSGAKR